MSQDIIKKHKCRLCEFQSIGKLALIKHYREVHGRRL